eukprot:347046-Rhodomonas_salina.3
MQGVYVYTPCKSNSSWNPGITRSVREYSSWLRFGRGEGDPTPDRREGNQLPIPYSAALPANRRHQP